MSGFRMTREIPGCPGGEHCNCGRGHEVTETQFRQETLRGYMERGLLYVRVHFGVFGTDFSPATNNTPANVAKWLRQLADDIEGIE